MASVRQPGIAGLAGPRWPGAAEGNLAAGLNRLHGWAGACPCRPLCGRPALVDRAPARPWGRAPGLGAYWPCGTGWISNGPAGGRKRGGQGSCAAAPGEEPWRRCWDGSEILRAGAGPRNAEAARGWPLAGICNRATASISAASPTGVDRLQSPHGRARCGEDIEALYAGSCHG